MNLDHATQFKRSIAFSGHRPSEAPGRSIEELKGCRQSLEKVFSELREEAKLSDAEIEITSSLAAGADIEAVEVCLALGIPLHVRLPKSMDQFQDDFSGYPDEQWGRVVKVIDAIQTRPGLGKVEVLPGEVESPECYERVNAAMLNDADALVVVWNGEVSGKSGGVFHVMQAAERRGIPVIVIDSISNHSPVRRGDWSRWFKKDTSLKKKGYEL